MFIIKYASTIEICIQCGDDVYYILYDDQSEEWDIYSRSPLGPRIITLRTCEECVAWLFNNVGSIVSGNWEK